MPEISSWTWGQQERQPVGAARRRPITSRHRSAAIPGCSPQAGRCRVAAKRPAALAFPNVCEDKLCRLIPHRLARHPLSQQRLLFLEVRPLSLGGGEELQLAQRRGGAHRFCRRTPLDPGMDNEALVDVHRDFPDHAAAAEGISAAAKDWGFRPGRRGPSRGPWRPGPHSPRASGGISPCRAAKAAALRRCICRVPSRASRRWRRASQGSHRWRVLTPPFTAVCRRWRSASPCPATSGTRAYDGMAFMVCRMNTSWRPSARQPRVAW